MENSLDEVNQLTINNLTALFQTLLHKEDALKQVKNADNKIDVVLNEIKHNFETMNKIHAAQQSKAPALAE